jgi:hypothetical protein
MYDGVASVSRKLGMTSSDVIRMGINEIIKKELAHEELLDLGRDTIEGTIPELSHPPQKAISQESSQKPLYLDRSMKKQFSKGDFEREIGNRIKEYIQRSIIEKNLAEWKTEAIKTIENEIQILQQKIRDFKRRGDENLAENLEAEIKKLRKMLVDRYGVQYQEGTGGGGALKLSEGDTLIKTRSPAKKKNQRKTTNKEG